MKKIADYLPAGVRKVVYSVIGAAVAHHDARPIRSWASSTP